MKRYKKLLGALSLGILFASCSESFLESEPQGYINNEQLEASAKWNPNIMLGQMLGTAQKSFAFGTGGTSNHDDFGQKSVDIATDLMSGDMVMGGLNYGWFVADARLLNNTKDRNRAYMIWRYYFQIIKAANAIFDAVGGDENMPDADSENLLYYGQAKAMRAYAYFNLVNLYAKPYEESKNTQALPIYRTQLVAETTPYSTVDQIYEFIINDLNDAIVALDGQTRLTKDTPDQYVAYGLLAYTYLQMGNWAKAAEAAYNVIEDNVYPIMTPNEIINSGFNNVNIDSWMWAIDLTIDNSPGLPTFWGHVDYFTYSYAAAGDPKLISDNLLAEIPATDYRRYWFNSKAPQLPVGKFYDAAREPMGNRLWDNDEVYMRVEEMYLILAEASARNNDLPTAQAALKALLDQRDASTAATVADMTKDELLDAIYYNWRVEMWGEGRGLITLKRFKKTATRGTNDATALAGKSYSYDDSRLYFNVPENEINNNPYYGK